MAWYGLARHLRSIWNLVTAAEVRMRQCVEPMEDI
jgi:hypothetical protein